MKKMYKELYVLDKIEIKICILQYAIISKNVTDPIDKKQDLQKLRDELVLKKQNFLETFKSGGVDYPIIFGVVLGICCISALAMYSFLRGLKNNAHHKETMCPHQDKKSIFKKLLW